ncbi:MAG: right-handed parallel beta-helix repeat-containing protein, partial [Chloroflexi bacterium]|nr:right-handed parallel beta-helix repeat-containing protein [Chloroflexota bacterium]
TPSPTPTPTPTPSPTPTPPPAVLRTLYVATTGNDAGPGTLSAPWRTIGKAASSALPGDLIYIRAGTYEPFSLRRSGSVTNPIILAGYPGDAARPIIDGRNVIPFVVDVGFVHDVQLRRLEVTGGYAERQNGGGVLVNNSTRVVVRESVLHDNSAYGIRSYQSTYVTIQANDIYGNGQGVDVRYAGEGTAVLDNLVHDQDRMMVNTVGGNDDTGAQGIGFVKSTGAALAQGNRLWNNRAASYDYGLDGGAFEIYAASNVTIADNTVWDSHNVLETGTDGIMDCTNNVFARNVAWDGNDATRTVGLVLRCAKDMLVTQNTFIELDHWIYDINTNSTSFSGKIDGLRIINNLNVMDEGKIYGLGRGIPLDTMVIDYNLDHNPGRVIASVDGYGNAMTTAQLTAWTGKQAHGVNSAPAFYDAAARDYTLMPGSAGIDRGAIVPVWSDGYRGSAPDIGRYEMQ